MGNLASPAPTAATPPTPPTPQPSPRADRKERIISLGSMLLFDIGLNIALFRYARAAGATEVQAYLLAMIGPLVSVAIEAVRHRRLSRFSVFIIAMNLLSALVSVIGSSDPRVLLLKDSALTGGFGLVVLATVTPLVPRPLMFVISEKFATDGTDEGVARWRGMWKQYPGFRRGMRVITAVWGVAYLIEALIRVVAVYTLTFDTAYVVGSVLPTLVTFLVIGWTFWYGARMKKAGDSRRAAALREAAA